MTPLHKKLFSFAFIAVIVGAASLLSACSVRKVSTLPGGATAGSPTIALESAQWNYRDSGAAAESRVYTNSAIAPAAKSISVIPAPAAGIAASAPMPAPSTMPEYDGNASGYRPEKIVLTGDISMETDIFDNVVESIKAYVSGAGGYVQNSNLYSTRRGDSDVRIFSAALKMPSDQFQSVKQYIEKVGGEGAGRILSSSENANDMTTTYYDTESRLKTKQIEEQRVLEMITKAEKIDDLLRLEERLSQIRTEIELYQTSMTNIDRLSTFSTIKISITEIPTLRITDTSQSFSKKLYNSFIASYNATVRFFESLIIWFFGAIIPLILLIICALIVILVLKVIKNKHKNTRRD